MGSGWGRETAPPEADLMLTLAEGKILKCQQEEEIDQEREFQGSEKCEGREQGRVLHKLSKIGP